MSHRTPGFMVLAAFATTALIGAVIVGAIEINDYKQQNRLDGVAHTVCINQGGVMIESNDHWYDCYNRDAQRVSRFNEWQIKHIIEDEDRRDRIARMIK